MIMSLIFFENEFLTIVSILFTALVLKELIMIAFEITTWYDTFSRFNRGGFADLRGPSGSFSSRGTLVCISILSHTMVTSECTIPQQISRFSYLCVLSGRWPLLWRSALSRCMCSSLLRARYRPPLRVNCCNACTFLHWMIVTAWRVREFDNERELVLEVQLGP